MIGVLKDKPAKGAFDILKTIIILGLPAVHLIEEAVWYECVADEVLALEEPIAALTVFGPSIFMICLGIGLAKSSQFSFMKKIGLQMIIINFCFNFFRFQLPDLYYMFMGDYTLANVLDNMLSSDIYYFVGLFYIFYAILRSKGVSINKFVIISAIMMVADCILSTFVSVENPYLGPLLGNFISGFEQSFFPLMGWCIFPCIGFLFERNVIGRPLKERNKIFLWILIISAVVLAGTILISNACGYSPITALADFANEGRFGVLQVLLILSVAMAVISLFYFIYIILPKNPIENFLLPLSALLFPFYMIQWMLVSLATDYTFTICDIAGNPIELTLVPYIILTVVIIALSAILTYWKGLSLSKWLLKITNFSKWSKKKKA